MTEIIQTNLFTGATALTQCNDFLETIERLTVVSVVPIYDVGASEMQYFVTYVGEI